MSNTPAPNKNVPQIPQPQADVGSLAYAVQQLKQGMDSLAGYRGTPLDRAVTFHDLVSLKVVSQAAATSATGTVDDPSSGVVNPYVVSGFSGPGALYPGQVILGHRFTTLVMFPANFGPIAITMASSVEAFVDAAGTPVLSIQRCLAAADPTVGGNWTQVGTATFASSSYSATLSTSNTVLVFKQNDRLRVIGPTPADHALAQIVQSFVGKR